MWFTLAFTRSGAGATTWIPEQDYLIRAASNTNTNFVVTTSPSLVLTDISAPGTNDVREDVLLFLLSSTFTGWNASIPVFDGNTYFIRSGAAGTLLLYLDNGA